MRKPHYPCIIDNFLSADPPLKQVVGNTFELGFRGQNALAAFGLGPQWGKLQWSAGLFRTTLTNDILPLTSTFNGFGYFTNVGTTLRQGAELSAQWTGDRWSAYANYTYIDAIYLSTFEEPSANNPLADANGNIPITNGTQIAGHSEKYGEGRRRLRRDPQLEGWRGHGRGVRPGHLSATRTTRFRKSLAMPSLACTRPTNITSKCRFLAMFRTFSISVIILPAAWSSPGSS